MSGQVSVPLRPLRLTLLRLVAVSRRRAAAMESLTDGSTGAPVLLQASGAVMAPTSGTPALTQLVDTVLLHGRCPAHASVQHTAEELECCMAWPHVFAVRTLTNTLTL